MKYNVIVIGGGVAGMNAALNVLRNNYSCLIIEKESFGGQIATSPKVENFPSVKEISGLDLSNNMFDQISSLGVEFELDEIKHIEKIDNTFYLEGLYNKYEADSVIIAVGVTHRHLNVDNEERLFGKGISYCAICDGSFYKDKPVVVIGDANSALNYSILLSNYCPIVHLCSILPNLRGERSMIEKVKSLPNVVIHYNVEIKQIIGDSKLEKLVFTDLPTGDEVNIDTDALFIAIGQIPQNEAFKNVCDLEDGYIVTNELMETKTEGLYAIGDCIKKSVRQVTTAIADGSIAGLQVCNYLTGKN